MFNKPQEDELNWAISGEGGGWAGVPMSPAPQAPEEAPKAPPTTADFLAQLQKKQDDADRMKGYLGVAGNVFQNFADVPTAYELLKGKTLPKQDVKGAMAQAAGFIKDPTQEFKKKYETMQQAKLMDADTQERDPNSKASMALKALAPRWGIQVTPEMSAYDIKQMIDPKKMMETEAVNKAHFENEKALKKIEHGYDLDKIKAGKDATPPTDGQTNAAGFARRLEQAEQVFKSLGEGGYDRTSKEAALQAGLPEWMQGGDSKSQLQAERNFVNAVLRRESGAAISKDEFKTAEQQYFPRAGDTPEVVAQKKANRGQALAMLKVAAGKAYDKVPLISPEPTPQQAQGEDIRAAAAAELARRKKTASNNKGQGGT